MRAGATTSRRESQGGYALLMVFLMAAIIALMLYQQLPRVAFESEREKEQLLIDRGEQYIRAIQLYYLANNRQWPTSIEDLEKREKRFLRRRYVDPYTGKDEWRIIHTTGGLLTDSLVQKAPVAGDSQSQSASNTANTTPPTEGQPLVNAAVLQRPSDRPVTPTPGFAPPVLDPDPPITFQGQGALPPITLQPGGTQPGLPPITLTPPGAGGGQQINGQNVPPLFPGQGQPSPFPGQPSPGGLPGGIQTGVPAGFRIDPSGQLVPVTPVPGQVPGAPGQQPGFLGQTQAIPGQPFSPPPAGQPGNQPGNQPPANQPGAPPGSPNAALNLINQLLTNPRQTTTTTPSATGNNQIGAIAGIASTHKGPSIKVYKDQTQYEKWEFVFTPLAGGVPGGGVGVPGGAAGGRGPNQPGGNQPGGFGGTPGPGGFGPGPGGFGGPGPGGPPQGIFGPGNGPGAGKQIFTPAPGR